MQKSILRSSRSHRKKEVHSWREKKILSFSCRKSLTARYLVIYFTFFDIELQGEFVVSNLGKAESVFMHQIGSLNQIGRNRSQLLKKTSGPDPRPRPRRRQNRPDLNPRTSTTRQLRRHYSLRGDAKYYIHS